MTQVVLFVIYDSVTRKFLSERRPSDHPHYPNQTTFPTGTVQSQEDLVTCLLRELKEELNIVPTKFTQLCYKPILSSKGNNLLYPFLITAYSGTLPEKILDKGNELVWETEAEIMSSSISSRPKILHLALANLE